MIAHSSHQNTNVPMQGRACQPLQAGSRRCCRSDSGGFERERGSDFGLSAPHRTQSYCYCSDVQMYNTAERVKVAPESCSLVRHALIMLKILHLMCLCYLDSAPVLLHLLVR